MREGGFKFLFLPFIQQSIAGRMKLRGDSVGRFGSGRQDERIISILAEIRHFSPRRRREGIGVAVSVGALHFMLFSFVMWCLCASFIS